MANVPYSEGVNSVEPQVQAPNDYQNIQTNPNQFGAGIGESVKELGQGMSTAAKFYGQAAADSVTNDFFADTDKILHGDPNKTTTGPDGQPISDVGFLGLKGRAAMDARPGAAAAMDDALKNARSKLSTPEQQLQFDNAARRYKIMALGQMGTHADQQANQWYSQVNKDSEVLAVGHIAANADDPELVKNGTEDLINARVKNAQLQGAQPGDSVYNAAITSGKRDALIAQVNAIGVKDPARAADILDQNKEVAGALYDNVANSLRARADQQTGQEVGAQAVKDATDNAVQPGPRAPKAPGTSSVPVDKDGTPFEKSHTSVLFGHLEGTNNLPQGYLGRTMQIESGGKDVNNPSGAAGYFQFMPGTAKQFGVNPHDLVSSADGAARLASANAQTLRLGLGRPASGGELYLAHQQGAGGAVKLLNNPNALASDIVGIKAVLQNGGTQGMSAQQFANMWINKYNGAKPGTVNPTPSVNLPSEAKLTYATPALTNANLVQASSTPDMGTEAPAAPTALAPSTEASTTSAAPAAPVQPISLKADAYQQIMSDPNLNYSQRAHALNYVNQTLQAQQIASDADQKAKKIASDNEADKIVQQMYSGDFTGVTSRINSSPNLEWRTREALHNMALAQGGDDTGKATQAYGPGFWDTYKKVTAPIGDPDRISDPTELMERAGPGGDLTLAGVKELTGAMMTGRKSVHDQAVQTTKASLLQYAKGKISYQEELYPGGPIRKDQKGEAIFQGQFIPKFMAAYDQWQKDGKDPWQFLTRDNVDKLAEGMRPASQMARDKLADTEGASGNAAVTAGQPPEPIPPSPANVDPAGWQSVMTTLPPTPTGQPFPRSAWAAAVQTLVADPSEKNITAFNNSKYGKGGFNGKEILDALKTGEPLKPKQPVAIIAPSDRENAEFIANPAFNVLNSMGP